jgi:glutathione S-transferase
MTDLEIIGRSSSHFTRTVRLLAHELGLGYRFRPVFDLTTVDPSCYGDNPALKIPVLVDRDGPLFGAENICRELVRRAPEHAAGVVLRGDVNARLVANAEELTLHAMAAEVTLLMAKASGSSDGASPKVRRSIDNTLTFLDAQLDAAISLLPTNRTVSFLEITVFCLVTHLPFREVLSVDGWPRLTAFCATFGARASAQATAYAFDRPAP